VGSSPREATYDSGNGYIYVSNMRQGTISIISPGSLPPVPCLSGDGVSVPWAIYAAVAAGAVALGVVGVLLWRRRRRSRTPPEEPPPVT
jgi:MYXO-CTERM domain-containing protein